MQGNAGRRTNFRSGSWSSKLVLEVGPRPWDGRCQMIVLVLASLLLGRMPCLGRGIPTRKSGRNFPHSIAVFADYCSLRGAHSPGHRPAPRPQRAATSRALSTQPQPTTHRWAYVFAKANARGRLPLCQHADKPASQHKMGVWPQRTREPSAIALLLAASTYRIPKLHTLSPR